MNYLETKLLEVKEGQRVLVDGTTQKGDNVKCEIEILTHHPNKEQTTILSISDDVKIILPSATACYRKTKAKNLTIGQSTSGMKVAESSGVGRIEYFDTMAMFDSDLAKEDDNNCVPRAVAIATGSTYKEAYDWCKSELGRVKSKGVCADSIFAETKMPHSVRSILGKTLVDMPVPDLAPKSAHPNRMKNYYKEYGEIIGRKMTIGSFLKKFKTGTYLIGVDKHAFCVKDGVIYGNPGDAIQMRRIVLNAIQLK